LGPSSQPAFRGRMASPAAGPAPKDLQYHPSAARLQGISPSPHGPTVPRFRGCGAAAAYPAAPKTGILPGVVGWVERGEAHGARLRGSLLQGGIRMFRLDLGPGGRYCDGMSRRSFLALGVAGMAGVGLPRLLRAREASAARKDTSVILIW